MGLDMYYYRRLYAPSSFDAQVVTVDGKEVPKENNSMFSRSTTEMVGYQRKANAVHNWFVQNLADGVDEHQKIPLHKDAVVALIEQIDFALATGEGMDPVSGFFFGSQKKDEYWKQDLEQAKSIATWLLKDMEESAFSSVLIEWWYEASW